MDIYPSKAQFSTNETVTLCLICDDVLPISVHIRVLLLSKTVWEQNIVLTENKTTVSIGAFSATFAGYGVNVYQQNDLEKPILQTAFDVAESPRKLLRYGFLSDFTEKDRDNLRAGIQRMVVYCGNADDGYINFDCVHISKSA